jgi:transcriptional regulator with XRE-family HTH domain
LRPNAEQGDRKRTSRGLSSLTGQACPASLDVARVGRYGTCVQPRLRQFPNGRRDTVLAQLIEDRRAQMGRPGHPLTWRDIAERAGLPKSTLHRIAFTTHRRLDAGLAEKLDQIAAALGMSADEVRRAALGDEFAPLITQEHADAGEQFLLRAASDLTPDQLAQVVALIRRLRTQHA